jgi:hypothetical protein
VGDRAARDAACDDVDIGIAAPNDLIGEQVPQQVDGDAPVRHQRDVPAPLTRQLVQQGREARSGCVRGIA